MVSKEWPNGLRYPLVGGTRQRRFDGTNFKPHKLPENAQTPTSRVHAALGSVHFARHFAFSRFSIKIANFRHQINAVNDLLYSLLCQLISFSGWKPRAAGLSGSGLCS